LFAVGRLRRGNVNTEAVRGVIFPVASEECVEKKGHILLSSIGKGNLDDVGHLVAIGVDESGLERAQVGGRHSCHILLHLCLL
jgi:hypothetical protein